MPFLTTARLTLHRMTAADAAFLVELMNDPDFVHFVGDRGVRDEAAARAYLREHVLPSYARPGHGHFLVRLREECARVGSCSLLRREELPDPDIGFAFLPAWRGRGYAFEAASALMAHARDALGLRRVVGLTAEGNERSARVLEKLGLRFERRVRIETVGGESRLFGPIEVPPGPGPSAPPGGTGDPGVRGGGGLR